MAGAKPEWHVADANLEFARQHVEHFYASDFFPDPPEFEAIWAYWPDSKAVLIKRNLADMGEPPMSMAAPKSGGGYRVVHQLQPLDTLTFTAAAHAAAESVEKRRQPKQKRIVCSYRIDLNAEGRFFDQDHDGYKTYHDRSAELADRYKYVLTVDIASFYNHIYVHRLQNSIEQCSNELRVPSQAIEEFLLNINQRQSVGIPIGPAASIIFSEAVLIDVDEFLGSSMPVGVKYVRYVDDFRFFCDSIYKLERVHHELTSYLYRAHRLTLSGGKTSLRHTTTFRAETLEPPEDAEKSALRGDIGDLIDAFDSSDYEMIEVVGDNLGSWEDASDEERREAIKRLFTALTNQPVLDIGLARHLLRRARRFRIRNILPIVISNAGFLLPVFRDVALYLKVVLSAEAVKRNLKRFEKLVDDKRLHFPFARHWLRWLFASRPEFSASRRLERYVMGPPEDVRSQAFYAITNRRESWVKNMKDSWRNLGPWDRRALILAGQVLAKTERNVWMDSIIDNPPELLDAIVAKFVRGR
jgi:hypothetical protein